MNNPIAVWHTEHVYFNQLLALLRKELDAGDWEKVKNAAPAGRDPLFGNGGEERYRELRRQIALEAQ